MRFVSAGGCVGKKASWSSTDYATQTNPGKIHLRHACLRQVEVRSGQCTLLFLGRLPFNAAMSPSGHAGRAVTEEKTTRGKKEAALLLQAAWGTSINTTSVGNYPEHGCLTLTPTPLADRP